MKNIRLFRDDRKPIQKIKDWTVTDPDSADFAFRVWGGNTEIPHLTLTDNIDFARSKSESSFLFIKTNAPNVRKVFDNFNTKRMFSERVGGAQNPGGVIFSLKQIINEYILTCEDLGEEPSFVDITEEQNGRSV